MLSKVSFSTIRRLLLGAAFLMAITPGLRAEVDPRLEHATRTDASEFVGGVPLGGVGTGTVELRGDGSFREWQIFNNWGNTPEVALFKHAPPFDLLNAFAAVRINDQAYVLETHPPQGLPGVAAIKYDGWFPFANLDYTVADSSPVQISLEAFSSYIPHDSHDSGIPALGLTYRFKNTSAQPVKVSLLLSLVNPTGQDCKEDTSGTFHVAESLHDNEGVGVTALDDTPTSLLGGDDNADTLKAFWADFTSPSPQLTSTGQGARFGQVVTFQLAPGAQKSERFVIGWFFPSHRENNTGPLVGHKYEAWSDSPAASVNLFAGRFDELRKATAGWVDTMKDSTWPDWVNRWLCNSQSTIAKYTWWVKDGRFMSYESPECPNSSPVHIFDLADWPVLDAFPDIELDLIQHFAHLQESGGKIPEEFAVNTTPSVTFPGGRDLYDVNPKFVLEVYHRWRETGNKDFLDAVWPTIEKAISYNDRHYDSLQIGMPSGKGIISTWDHWSNEYGFSFGGSLTLASLRAAQELAKVEGDADFVQKADDMFNKCQASMNDHFWNGEFYGMAIDADLKQDNLVFVDAVYGDSFARFIGLGNVLPDDKSLSTLRAIAKYNSQATPYGLVISADTSGKMVEYHGDARAQITTCHTIPAPIALIQLGNADDQATGLSLLRGIYSIAEKHPGGLWNMPHHVIAATGERNVDDFPHYLRDRCIWALLKVLNGWNYDAADQKLTLGPVLNPEKSRGPWICSAAYGTLSQQISGNSQTLELAEKDGTLTLGEIDARSRMAKLNTVNVLLDGKALSPSAAQAGDYVKLTFAPPLKMAAGDKLAITFSGTPAAGTGSSPGN